MLPFSARSPPASGRTPLVLRFKPLIVNIEFPERPGALRKFLLAIQTKWNISLFHYRNHGAGERNLVLGRVSFVSLTSWIFKMLGRSLLGSRFHLKIMSNSTEF